MACTLDQSSRHHWSVTALPLHPHHRKTATCQALPVDGAGAPRGTDRHAQLLQPRRRPVGFRAAVAAAVAGGAPQADALLLCLQVIVGVLL